MLPAIIKKKRSKAFNMKFHWMIDRIKQGQLWLYWGIGINDWADYSTKHHPSTHHKLVYLKYIHMKKKAPLFLIAQSLVE